MTDSRSAVPPRSPHTMQAVAFRDLPGWAEDDHAAAFAAFLASARAMRRQVPKSRAIPAEALLGAAERALAAGPADGAAARSFFEKEFRPFLVRPDAGGAFFTGYYEPEVSGSRVRTERFTIPLYRRPDDLVEVDEANPPPGVAAGTAFARRTAAGFAPYPDRREIESGFLAGRGLELVWLEDPIDAFFIHVQGSARVRIDGDDVVRVTYAAKSGHPYTPIGRVLRERGALSGTVTMATIRAWLAAHPDAAREVMWANRSFIFFRETEGAGPDAGPIAAAGVALTPGRSLAVDRRKHTFHSPIFVTTTLPDGTPFRRLMVAQDTGTAIVGPARGDIFFGTGDEAGRIAGAMQAGGSFFLLAPAGTAPEGAA